jgi:thiamine-phosphate pyrophosphorylase
VKGLYAILDLDAWRARGVDPRADGVAESIAAAFVRGGATTVQLRAKNEGGRATLELLRRLRSIDVPLYANDRADLAALAPTPGIHVGQDDLPVADVRRCFPSLAIGVSTHNEAQLREALAAKPTYVAFGPVFGTTSKERPDPVVGLDGVRMAANLARDASVPLVVIGGIDRTRLKDVRAAGGEWFAVISDLIAVRDGAPDLREIEARARAFAPC